MSHAIAVLETAGRPHPVPSPCCVHEFIRVDKWSECLKTEGRVTDDFGREAGPMRHRKMTTVYEKYRCRVCGAEDVQSYTTWQVLKH